MLTKLCFISMKKQLIYKFTKVENICKLMYIISKQISKQM